MRSIISNHKNIAISIICLLLVFVLGLMTYNFAFATSSKPMQTPTKTHLEENQERIDQKRTEMANIKDLTLKASYGTKLMFYEKQATEQAAAATQVPTLTSLRNTEVAKKTATAYANPQKGSGVLLFTREPGLHPEYSNRYLAKDVKMNGAWFENQPDGPAIIYIAGLIRGTKQGMILRYDEATNHIDRYRLSFETGDIEIVGKKGNTLVLKTKHENSLFFDTITNQFSDENGNSIPIDVEATPTIVSPYPAP